MSALETQKALFLSKDGKYSVGEAPVPRPGPKDVLIKVMSAALNPIDWKVLKPPFSAWISSYPSIRGVDGAGIAVETGEEVAGVKQGDRVLFQGWFTNPMATFQQFCIIPAELTARIPENLSFDQAATIPLALATVVLGLYNQYPSNPASLRFKPVWEEGGTTDFSGKPAFIVGGASTVGQYAIQIARLAGFDPIVTTASPRNTQLLTLLGATRVLDRSLPEDQILTQLSAITDGKPLEFVYDAISLPETMPLAYRALAPGGALAIVLQDVIPAELKQEGDGKRIVHVFADVHSPENRACGIEMYKRLTGWLESDIIKPNSVEVLPNGLAAAPDGLERLQQNEVSATKLLLRPQETPWGP